MKWIKRSLDPFGWQDETVIQLNQAEQATLKRAGEILTKIDDMCTDRYGIDWVDGADMRTDLALAAYFLTEWTDGAWRP